MWKFIVSLTLIAAVSSANAQVSRYRTNVMETWSVVDQSQPLNLNTATKNLRALKASKSSKEKDTSSKEKDTKSSKSKSSEGGGTNAPTATPKHLWQLTTVE
ncbi:hypothetical protein ACHAXH_007935 [Discostella pseudostelligera]